MSGWLDWVFGNLPPPPRQPSSRGATFGANYQGLPTSSRIDDRRQDPTDQAYWMKRAPSTLGSQVLSQDNRVSTLDAVPALPILQRVT